MARLLHKTTRPGFITCPICGSDVSGPLSLAVVTDVDERLAWYSTCTWGPRGSYTAPEITICAETLYRPTAEIITSLVHEMVHHSCAVGGVRDTTTKGYHNQHFRDAAEAAGPVVEREGPQRWAWTSAGRAYRGAGHRRDRIFHLSRLSGVARAETEHPNAALVVWLHDHPRRDRGAYDMYTLRTGVLPTMTQVPNALRFSPAVPPRKPSQAGNGAKRYDDYCFRNLGMRPLQGQHPL